VIYNKTKYSVKNENYKNTNKFMNAIGTLDLGATGIHINADLLSELTEFLSGIDLPLTGVNYDDNSIGVSDKSTMENNVIKLYFDQI